MKQLLKQLEASLKASQHASVVDCLNRINLAECDPGVRLSLSRIASRAKHPFFVLKALRHVVQNKEILAPRPSPEETLQYANALDQLGANREAQKFYDKLFSEGFRTSELFKYRAFSKIYQWNYLGAIPDLMEFLKLCEENSYEALVAQINLIASLLNSNQFAKTELEIERAKRLLSQINKQNSVLAGNLLELEAILYFYQDNFDKAERLLKIAGNQFKHSGSVFSLFIEKWLAVIGAKRDPRIIESRESLRKVRKKALKLKHWHSVRECDLYEGLIFRDSKKLARVFHGSSMPYYRMRIKALNKSDIDIPDSYFWSQAVVGKKQVLDIENMKLDGNDLPEVLQSTKLRNLLSALTAEIYMPLHIGYLFHCLFPDEYFDPYHSPARIFQLIARLRKLLIRQSIELQIEKLQEGYATRPDGSTQIKITSSQTCEASSKYDYLLRDLTKKVGNEVFNAKMVQGILQCDRSKANRVIRCGLDNGKIHSIGVGKGIKYKIAA